jgi:TonB-linked SusC/RagA family outer membrane protein
MSRFTKLLRFFALAAVTLVVALPLSAQVTGHQISGKVVDNSGAPINGATVVVNGTTQGALSDTEGNFTLNVAPDAILNINFMGYVPQQLVVGNRTTITVTLQEDTTEIDDVIVIGYGVQKKSDLTGAISQVTSKDMVNRTITNPQAALQGKTAGVQVFSSSARPGAAPQIRIRGVGSNGSSDPLYVVDGRIASDISGIDPNDIESMEVLKDGASAAIYGAQAGNGVVLVTTKRGRGDGKITYDYQFTTQSLARVPKVLNSEQYIDYYTEAKILSMDAVYSNWDFVTNTDWVDFAFGNSAMHRHNLTFQSGNERGSFYASMSYLNNDGMFIGNADTYERITGMINASWKIKPWLEVGTNNQIEHYTARTIPEGSEYGGALLATLTLDPLTKPMYTADELPPAMRDVYDNPSIGTLLGDGNGNYYGLALFGMSENLNPLIQRDRSYSENRGFNLNGTAYLNFTPIKGLTVTSRLGYRFSGNESYGYGKRYWTNTNAKQTYLSVNASANLPVYYQWENFLNYSRSFGKHNASIMLGTSYSQNRSFGVNGSIQGTGPEDIGFRQDNPLFLYFAYATGTATKSVSGGEASFSRRNSYFGRFSYDYDGKYLLQVSLRGDAVDSSVLPVENRWGYFPSVSVGWEVSRESFMESTRTWLQQLKIRASWGQNGSTASLGNYSYDNVIAAAGNYAIGVPGDFHYQQAYAPSSTGNKDLKWETSEQTNIGLDARFLKSRLSLTIDWYKKATKDLIVTGTTPSTLIGNTASPLNAGNVTNSGIEFELGWQDVLDNGFSYGVRGNIATLKNEVTYLHPTLTAIDGVGFHTYGAITRFEIGQPAWYFYGYQFEGIDTETGNPKFADLDESGDLGAGDKTYIGKGLPDVSFGLTLNAAYKGFDIVVFGAGTAGNDIYSCLTRSDYNVNKLSHTVSDRWTETYKTGSQPRAGAADMDKYMTSSASVYDGSYFKIKQIQLGYTFPANWTKKIYVDNARVYVSLEDFFTFSNYPGFDPEVTGVGNGLGVDKGSYPTSKKIVFGVNVTF